MKAAMAELTNSRNERQRAKEMLLMKHKKIEDFEKLAVRIFLVVILFKGRAALFWVILWHNWMYLLDFTVSNESCK